MHPAITTALADRLVDKGPLGGIFHQAALAPPAFFGRTGLIINKNGDPFLLTQITLYSIQVIAMFNLCTGYFLSQRAFESMAEGSLTDPDNIARQKRLLARLVGAVMPGTP